MEEKRDKRRGEETESDLLSPPGPSDKGRAAVAQHTGSESFGNGAVGEDTSAGAVDEAANETSLDSLEAELEIFTCEEAGCVWPCDHHWHVSKAPDFWAKLSDVAVYADLGCAFCALFRAVSRSRCTCTGAQLPDRMIRRRHRGRNLKACFVDRVLVKVVFNWECPSPAEMNIEFADPTGTIPFLPRIQGNVHTDRVSPESIALYKGWIERCETTHPTCPRLRAHFAPFRLIEVHVSNDLPGVKLLKTPDRPTQYIALSHCWGDTEPLKTECWNLSTHEQYISWAIIPKSYQDTITLARKLGVRYVWIDSLCIVQDDAKEKVSEIRRMGEVYRQAYLVVVAGNAKSPYSGYLEYPRRIVRKRDGLQWQDFMVRYRELSNVTVKAREMLLSHRTQREDACSSQLTQTGRRAWTYQERLLASRCLIFQDHDVVWECKTACYCECSGDRSSIPGKQYRPQMLLPVSSNPSCISVSSNASEVYFASADDAYDFWKRNVQIYSSRGVSKISDRLPAISALASAVHDVTKDVYLAGLWKGDLAAQLLWYCVPVHSSIAPFLEYVAPSWSWASINSPTRYYLPPSEVQQRLCVFEIVDAKCMVSGQNPFGPVTDGYLIIKAINCKAYAAISGSSIDEPPKIRLVLENREIYSPEESSTEYIFLDRHPVISQEVILSGGHCSRLLQKDPSPENIVQTACAGAVQLLWIGEIACLILSQSQNVAGAFKRLGLLYGDMAPRPPDYSPSTITLI